MKAASRFLSVFLAFAMVFSCSACASGADTAAGEEEAGQEGTGDDVFYAVGTNYFTALPEGSKILVQRDGSRAPLEGVFHGDDESTDAFLNGIMGFSYEGKDKDGKDVNLTLFANSMTESGHQRDEYAFISNALFASFLTETPYATAAGEPASGSDSTIASTIDR